MPDSDMEVDIDSLTVSEKSILAQAIEGLGSGDGRLARGILNEYYEEPPVDIIKFIDDPQYLGKSLTDEGTGRSRVFPYWRDRLPIIHASNCTEVALTGPIGNGKSTIADICLAYHAYDVINLIDAFAFYGLTRVQPIAIIFFSLTKDLSETGLYRGFNEMLVNSPWFRDRGVLTGSKNPTLTFPHKNLVFALGSPKVSGYGIVGKTVIAGALDEISEVGNKVEVEKGEHLDLAKTKGLKIYSQVARRMESRFMQDGTIPGKLYLASSKQDEAAFLERYLERVRGQKHVMIFDDPLWEVKPRELYRSEVFQVAVGDRFKEPFVLTEGQDADELEKQGYEIIEPPVDFKKAFMLDVNGALRDIAGYSNSYMRRTKLIPRMEYLEACIDDSIPRPFKSETLYLSEHDDVGIEDAFEFPLCMSQAEPRFIHLDLALSGDAAGIACGYPSGQRSVDRVLDDGTMAEMSDSIFSYDFMMRICNMEGSQVPFWKIRRFILWLQRKKGVHICRVTVDGFQSADMMMLLKRAKVSSELLSVDRKDDAYMSFRSAVLEARLRYYRYGVFMKEAEQLDHKRSIKRVDHPDNGSKDVADCAAGAYYSFVLNKVVMSRPDKTVEALREFSKASSDQTVDPLWWLRG